MTQHAWLMLGLYMLVLLVLAKPLGGYIANVMEGRKHLLSRVGAPFESLLYRLAGGGIEKKRRDGWRMPWPCFCSVCWACCSWSTLAAC